MRALYKCAQFSCLYYVWNSGWRARVFSTFYRYLFFFCCVVSVKKSSFCYADFSNEIYNVQKFYKHIHSVCTRNVFSLIICFCSWLSMFLLLLYLRFSFVVLFAFVEQRRKRARNFDLVSLAFLSMFIPLTFLRSVCWLLNSFLIFNALKLVEGIFVLFLLMLFQAIALNSVRFVIFYQWFAYTILSCHLHFLFGFFFGFYLFFLRHKHNFIYNKSYNGFVFHLLSLIFCRLWVSPTVLTYFYALMPINLWHCYGMNGEKKADGSVYTL